MNLAFILGIAPRSGTTFLHILINSHPDCKIANEPNEDYMVHYSDSLLTYAEELSNHWIKHQSKSTPEKPKAKIMEALGKGLATLRIKNQPQITYISKTPSTQNLDEFFQLFPSSKVIIILRNGKDLIESSVKSFDSSYKWQMEYYCQSANRIIDFKEKWQSKQDQFLVVYYENLVRYTKLEADRIFTFLGVNPYLVTQEKLQSLPIIGSSTNKGKEDNVHWNPVYDKSDFNPLKRSGDWSDELNQQFEEICGDVSHKLGYDLETNLPIKTPDYCLTDTTEKKVNRYASQKQVDGYFHSHVDNNETIKDELRNLFFFLGEQKTTQGIYRFVYHNLTKIKYNIFAPKTDYYSYARNDRWIVEYIFSGKYKGTFVEVGALDGKNNSSCYVLEKEYQWQGICIEPKINLFESIVDNRPQSICENAYLIADNDNYEEARKKITARNIIRLSDLLDRYNTPKVIDYASFHLDGKELEILHSFLFDKYIFLALTLSCSEQNWQSMTKLLNTHNYQEVKNPFNQNKPEERYWLHQSIKQHF